MNIFKFFTRQQQEVLKTSFTKVDGSTLQDKEIHSIKPTSFASTNYYEVYNDQDTVVAVLSELELDTTLFRPKNNSNRLWRTA